MVAVVVAHNGEAWLPRTLAGLARQVRAPDEVIAVDASSGDRSAALLGASLPTVVRTGATTRFLDAVRGALLTHDARRLTPAPPMAEPPSAAGSAAGPGQEWVWLLHDDSAPHPEALARLLEAVERAPSVAVAGCKQRSWSTPERLLQAGFTTSRLGRPVTGVEPGDVDQGQSDDREDVLAVGTAGMLVRRDVWDELGGGNPGGLVVGEDVDFCRRVHLAGHRVVVVPGAVVEHAEASRTGRRPAAVLPRGWVWTARRDQTLRRLVEAPAPLLPLTVIAVLVGALGRLAARCAATQPRRALTELAAVVAVLARPAPLWRARRAAARTRVLPRRALRPLLAPVREVAWWHRDRWQRHRLARTGPPPVVDPRRAGGWRTPALLVAALAAAAVVAQHHLLGPGPVSGGALAAAPASLFDLWTAARSSWVPAGLGAPGPAHPFLTTLAALSLPLGSPALAVTVLLVLAVPLAGLAAWVAAGAATGSRCLRGYAAVSWAAGPPLLLAVGSGRLAALVAHLALPWVALAVARTATARSRRSAWTSAGAGGLAFAAAATSAPVLLPAGVLVLLVVAAVAGRRAGRSGLPVLAVPVPALVLAGPWLLEVRAAPWLLLADPGRPLASVPVEAWRLLLGQPHPLPVGPLPVGPLRVDVDLVAVASGTLLVLLAAVALLRGGPRGSAVRIGWALAVVGLVAAVAASRVPVTVEDGGTGTGTGTGWAGPGTSLVLLGLLTAVVAALDGTLAAIAAGPSPRRSVRAPGWRRGAVPAVATLAVLLPVVGLVTWTSESVQGGSEVSRGAAPGLPAVAADAAASPDRARTLVLRALPDGSVSAGVTRSSSERLDRAGPRSQRTGAAGAPDHDAAEATVAHAVAALSSGTEDARARLIDLGVGYVLLLAGADGARLSADTLDALPGLTRAGEVDAGELWRVTPPGGDAPDAPDRPARARVLLADGTAQLVLPAGEVALRTDLPAGDADRLLVLAERADPGWTASLDGAPLDATVHGGWAQAFRLPPAGGDLVVEHVEPSSPVWSWAQGVAVGLAALLLLPVGVAGRRAP